MPGHEKNKKGRQKRDGNSPDKEEDAASNPDSQRKNVIFSEEIAQLQIKEDDLRNLSQQQQEEASGGGSEESAPSYQKVAVRKEIPESERKPPLRRVGLLKRAPPDAPLKDPDAAAHMGPRFDDQGKIVAHSILGSPEEFYRLAVQKGQLRQEEVPEIYRTPRGTAPLSVKYARRQPPFPFPVTDLAADENAALRNWELRMQERKRQQGYISKLVGRPASQLAMNAGEEQRRVTEERHLIDRSIPFVDYGKGYRAGSEFWQQATRIGDEDSGLHATLTQTEKGYPPAMEHVGNSTVARAERGLQWEASPRRGGRYPWKGPFYQQRTAQLREVMQELDPHLPDFENLEVIGQAVGHVTVRSRPTTAVTPSVSRHSQRSSQQTSEQLGSLASASAAEADRPSGQSATSVPGPSLLFGGQPARWFGDPTSYKDTIGIEARVILETPAGRPTSQCLNIENDGSTVLFYRWKKLPKPNPFNLVQQEVKQFYFDTSNGVLLPGESLHFPFIFKSDRPGLFAEQWQLETTPVVCGGAALVVTLRGIAVQEDLHAGRRSELEAKLERESAAKIVTALLDEILDGIQSPERPKTPIDAYITECEIFQRQNPGLSFTMDTLARMHKLHKDVAGQGGQAPHDWDLSVASLRAEVLALSEDRQGKKEEFNAALYSHVVRISFGVDLPRAQAGTRQHQLCYVVVMETMDRIFNDWWYQRTIRHLPEMEMEFPDPSLVAKDTKAKRGKGGDKQKSVVSKDSGKPAQRTDTARTAATRERTRSPRRIASGANATTDAGRSFAEQQPDDAIDEEESETPEALAERLCRERIYANTYCLLAGMVETIADICEAAR